MRFIFKVIIVFFIVFNFRVPVLYNSAFVSILLSAIYYIYRRGSIPFTRFFQRYNAVILIGNILIAFVAILIPFLHHTEIISTPEKRLWVQFMMLWAMIFALPLLVDGKESKALEELSVIFCYAFAIQGLICLVAYLYPPLGDFLFNMKPDNIKESVLNASGIVYKFRLYNLSGILFVELTAAFGVAFIVFFWFQLRFNNLYMKGWKKYIIFFFIFLGTVFTGRTGFFGLLFGLGGWLMFSFDRIFTFLRRNILYLIGAFSIILFIYYFVFTGNQRKSFDDEVFPFAFEWYYNYRDYGKFEVNSMEATPYHYYYLNDETLLKGDGVIAFGGGSQYPHSDAGYTNTLVFGGIPFLICLIIYQCLYFARPIAITLKNNSRNNKIDCVFFFILFIYIFVVDIKTPAIGYMHLVEAMYLALGSGYISQYYLQKEQREVTG